MKHLITIVAFTILSTRSAFALRLNGIVSNKQNETSIVGKKIVIGEVEQYELINFPKSKFGKVTIDEELDILKGEKIALRLNSDILFQKHSKKQPLEDQNLDVKKNGQCHIEINRENIGEGKIAIRANEKNILNFSDNNFDFKETRILSSDNLRDDERSEIVINQLNKSFKKKYQETIYGFSKLNANELLFLLEKTRDLDKISPLLDRLEYKDPNHHISRSTNRRIVSEITNITRLSRAQVSQLLVPGTASQVKKSIKRNMINGYCPRTDVKTTKTLHQNLA